MNIKLNAKLRAYTKSSSLSFLNNIPSQDGEYILTVTVQNGEQTFSWVKKQEEE